MSGKLGVQGSKITMELPRIAGFTRDLRAYELTAETAVQDIAKPDVIELQNLRAKMELQDKDVVEITAKSGTYNTKGDRIVLRDQIVVTSPQGYKALLREAAVDMKKGNVVSEQPVEIKLPNGTLKANRMEIVDSGDVDPLRTRRRARSRCRKPKARRSRAERSHDARAAFIAALYRRRARVRQRLGAQPAAQERAAVRRRACRASRSTATSR